MSAYHIAKNGRQTGPVDEDAVRQQITVGALTASDLCWCEGMADWQPIRTVFNCPQRDGAPLPPTGQTGITSPCPHQLGTFPVAVAVVLHYVTFGIFTLVWLNLMHGKISRVRADDPSAGKAVGFCFIPLFNIYWIFFTYRRLCLRVDEQRELYRLRPGNLRGLATTVCILQILPYVNFLLGYTIVMPIFLGMMQASVNELAKTSRTTMPSASLPVSQAPAGGLPGGVIAAIICACLVPAIALLTAIAIPNFIKARDASQRNICISNMRMIHAAKESAALAHAYQDGQTVQEEQVSAYLKKGFSGLACPRGGRYTINPIGEEPECSTHGAMSAAAQRR